MTCSRDSYKEQQQQLNKKQQSSPFNIGGGPSSSAGFGGNGATAAGSGNPMTYFVFRSWRLRRDTLTIVVTCLLVLSLLMERFCFIVSVYKAKYYGYTLILIVIFLNCLFNLALAKLRHKKHKKRLHEIFDLDRTPHVGWCIIGIIGAFDMLYAFFLFWPANVIPIWLLCALLQFFIPLNMFFRSCCVGNSHYKRHIVAGLIVTCGVVITMIDVIQAPEDKDLYLNYALLFLLSSLLDVISHSIKESIVRS